MTAFLLCLRLCAAPAAVVCAALEVLGERWRPSAEPVWEPSAADRLAVERADAFLEYAFGRRDIVA